MTNHPGKPSIQTEAWVSIYPNFYWVGYHPLKAVGTSIFTHGQACRGVTWSTKSELKFQRYWPVLYSIRRAVGPSMQGPINGIYQHNDQYKLNWDNVVNSANNNRSVTDPDLFTIRRCRIWWHSIQKRFGNLVFHETVWDSITEQIPDHVNLPQPPANKRVPKAVLARVRRIIANTIFELVLDNKLQLRTVDSGKVDLTVPRGMWTRHVFPTVLERLQKDSFEGGSIADQVIKRCSTYRTTHDVLRSWWGRWPARHSMSWEEWSSSASPRQWVRDDVTIDPINGTRIGRQETVTDIASYDTNRGHYVERREILGTCATKIDTDLSIRVSAWLSASVPRRTSDTGRSQHNATLARCRITKGHLATETYTFKLHDSDSKVSQEKVHDMHRPGSYGTNERLKAAQDLSRGGVKFGLTDSIPKHVHEQIEEHSVQSISRLTYCGLCSHMGQECDGERLCGQCVRKSTSCREQGQPLASSQDLKTKCYACFKQGQRCCGSRPCGFCAKHHKRCRDQGENEKTTPRAQIEFLEITQQPAAAQHFRHLQSIPWGLLHQWHRLQQRHGPLWESETWIVVCTVESSYKKRASSRPTAIALPLTGRRSKSLIRLQLASSIQLSHTSTR